MSPSDRVPLRLADLGLLAAFCAVLFSFPILFGRTLTPHETVHCQNVREMLSDGDWIIPHYGGRPWLERPPLPFWLTLPVVALAGDSPAAFRLASALAALPCVLLVGWIASMWYGRSVGVLAGLVLATTQQFNHYATGPEADIFLCTVVTAALALFVRLEFLPQPYADESAWPAGRRPWALAGFFALVGLANLVKGLFFGDAFILAPVAGHLLLGDRRWQLVRRYVWLPGWLLALACGAAWAVAAYLRHPDVVELWFSDYGGRVHQGFMREPAWYYLAQLPWVLFPWTVAAGLGLAVTWRGVRGQGRTPERFLWCWALLPVLLLSLPQGKHHHYLLQGLAPWAILSALGVVRLWQWLRGLSWLAWLTGRRTAVAALALAGLVAWGLHALPHLAADRYAGDRAFVRAVLETVPPGEPILVLDDEGPLDASWLLFYLEGRGRLVHNATFLAGPGLGRDAWLITRRRQEAAVAQYARGDRVLQSAFSRDERFPVLRPQPPPAGSTRHPCRVPGAARLCPEAPATEGPRYALYRLRFREGPWQEQGPVYISPMQATGRAPGPLLSIRQPPR